MFISAEAGSITSASAPSSPAFIDGRAIAGVGAGGMFQGALGVIGFVAPLGKRSMFFCIVISGLGFATCFDPIMGGVLTDHPVGGGVSGCMYCPSSLFWISH